MAHTSGLFDPLGTRPAQIVSAGKAAWPMARAAAELLGHRTGGCLIAGPVPATSTLPNRWVICRPSHPLPDDQSVAAGRHALEQARRAADGWLLVLLSGGASAMLALPSKPLTLDVKREATRALLRAGTRIDRLNVVRKHLSGIKGGQLGAAAVRSLTLAISDVHAPVADDPAVIASGPTAADPSTFAEAVEVARTVEGIPSIVLDYLARGAAGEERETVKPGDPRLAEALYHVIGNRQSAMREAVRGAESLGYTVEVVPEPITGEARDASRSFIARVHAIAGRGARPLCVIGTGETTVHVSGSGTGGRNQEFALAAVPFLARIGRAAVLASAGTDGTDGPTDAAGAIADSSSLERSQQHGLDWEASLRTNDAYHFFEPLGDLLIWGPTQTNVGDLQIMLIA